MFLSEHFTMEKYFNPHTSNLSNSINIYEKVEKRIVALTLTKRLKSYRDYLIEKKNM